MVIKIIAYALVIIAAVLNFVIPGILKRRGGDNGAQNVVRVKIAALAVAAAALVLILIFVR